MYQGFSGDFDSASRCSSSPSEPQYLSSVDSFSQSVGSPTTTAQECTTGVGEMPGSFVPTLTAITTSQDLQWMVQPTVISSAAQSQAQAQLPALPQPSIDPYNLPGTSYSTGGMCPYSRGEPSKPTRSSRPRRARDETLTAEEEEKRRVRRERNKLAAAKCRNRRRELTDRLQSVSSRPRGIPSSNDPRDGTDGTGREGRGGAVKVASSRGAGGSHYVPGRASGEWCWGVCGIVNGTVWGWLPEECGGGVGGC
ncbi:protein fosB [Chiloscyllium plagiosum]|uniref:protein fosB n=1 Tax=Chiloscyllium plagiosum TaxID=36176 RepID=UPI001CB87334|nr:protein fosB [Chiloscyllium plagiosum]